MDYLRSPARARVPARIGRKPKTGPFPTIPWRDLDRKVSIEDALPILLLLAFALLAGIQAMLIF